MGADLAPGEALLELGGAVQRRVTALNLLLGLRFQIGDVSLGLGVWRD